MLTNYDIEKRILYSDLRYYPDFSEYIFLKSKVYLDVLDDEYVRYQFSFIDDEGDPDSECSYLSTVSPRFKYRITADIKSADYIICDHCEPYDNDKFELLADEKIDQVHEH